MNFLKLNKAKMADYTFSFYTKTTTTQYINDGKKWKNGIPYISDRKV